MQKPGAKTRTLATALIGLLGAMPLPSLAADPAANGNPGKTSPGGAAHPAKAEPPVAFIAASSLRIYLGAPTAISLYNAAGQLLFHVESGRSLEVLPLNGINTGFLYLTLHTGKSETTRKLVYTGK